MSIFTYHDLDKYYYIARFRRTIENKNKLIYINRERGHGTGCLVNGRMKYTQSMDQNKKGRNETRAIANRLKERRTFGKYKAIVLKIDILSSIKRFVKNTELSKNVNGDFINNRSAWENRQKGKK